MSMRPKDYIALAKILHSEASDAHAFGEDVVEAVIGSIAKKFADLFEAGHPSFDRARFIDECKA